MHAANQGWCSLNRVSPGAALELGAEGMAEAADEVGLEDSLTVRSRAAILSAMASRAVPSLPPAVVGGSLLLVDMLRLAGLSRAEGITTKAPNKSS